MKLRLHLIVGTLCLFGQTVLAQVTPSNSTVTLKMLLASTSTNPEVQSARLQLETAERTLQSQIPITLDTTGGYSLSSNPSSSGFGGSVNLNFNLGGEALAIKRRAVESARRSLRTTEFRAKRSILDRWHGLRQASSFLETARIGYELAQKQDQLASLRLQGGAITSSERERNQLALEEKRIGFERATLKLNGLRNQLQLNTRLNVENLELSWKALPKPIEKQESIDARDDIARLLDTLSDLQTQLRRAQIETSPTIALAGNVSGQAGTLSGSLNSNLAGSVGYTTPTPTTGAGYTISLTANIRLDPSSWSQFSSLQAGIDLAKTALEDARTNARLEIETKKQDVTLAQNLLTLAKQDQALSQNQLKGIQQRVSQGSLSELDLLKAQIDLQHTRETLLTAENNFDTTVLDWYEAQAISFPEIL
jgi:Outer membrane efflux protein